jgi:hypothetical protein
LATGVAVVLVAGAAVIWCMGCSSGDLGKLKGSGHGRVVDPDASDYGACAPGTHLHTHAGAYGNEPHDRPIEIDGKCHRNDDDSVVQ